MPSHPVQEVHISEVGPRDGLQSVKGIMSTADKFRRSFRGLRTGNNLERLIAARIPLQAGLPGEPLYGMAPAAGLPKNFTQTLSNEAAHG